MLFMFHLRVVKILSEFDTYGIWMNYLYISLVWIKKYVNGFIYCEEKRTRLEPRGKIKIGRNIPRTQLPVEYA